MLTAIHPTAESWCADLPRPGQEGSLGAVTQIGSENVG